MTLAALLKRHAVDALIVLLAFAALLAVVAEIKVWIVPGPEPKAVFIVGSLLWTLPLLLRRRFPFAAPVFTFAVQAGSAAAIPTLGVETTSLFALLFSFWVVGAHNDRGEAIAGAAIGFASIVVVAQLARRVGASDAVVGIVIGGVIWLIAFALRRREQRAGELEERASLLEREHEELVRAGIAAERRRIARDLHDVIAHSVSVMIVQAGAARVLLDDEPERARASAFAVEETGHQALVEVRRLLGMLGKEDPGLAPRPGLAALNALVKHTRGAGLRVDVRVQGEPHALPPGIDLTAYRIVQEALTNTLRHAGPVRAEVRVSYETDGLQLEIANDRGRGGDGGGGSGHGLRRDARTSRSVRGRAPVRAASDGRLHRPSTPARRDRTAVIRILIADDQALVRGGFHLILDSQKDMEVVGEAADGREALAQARELKPDVVLMDIRMPELDGLEATRRLVAGDGSACVLILTTFDADEYVYEAMKAGASGFLLKDVRPEQLAEAVRVVASGDTLLAPAITRRLIEEFVRRPPPGSGAPTELAELTARELEVLKLVARGLSNTEIAASLFVSDATVKTHVTHILAKLNLRARVQAAVLAYESGLVQPGGT